MQRERCGTLPGVLNLWKCVTHRLGGGVTACKAPAVSGKQSLAGPVLVTCVSIMLLIISCSLSDVFESK